MQPRAGNINSLLGLAAALIISEAAGQLAGFTSKFPIEECHFSVFGGQPHFTLNPGHQLVLRGEDEGEQKELTVTPLDETKEITVRTGERTRRILARVVEERERVAGELAEVARYWYARCIETGDVYYFGEEVEFYENGVITGRTRLWEAGVNGALPGIIMPRSFMLGARYHQALAPGAAIDQAENTAMELSVMTPAGRFENCVQVDESDGLKPELAPSLKTYATGVGLIKDESLELEEFRLGTTGLPAGCTWVPFSDHPFLPLAPGRQLVLEGEEDGERIRRVITVLDQTKEISLMAGNARKNISARVVEERETRNGELIEVSRNFLAQCLETGDVYYFGREIDFYQDGAVVGHNGAWLAGVANAQPGIMMPGNFAVGARYFQESAPGVAMVSAVNTAKGATLAAPAGTFSNCVTVTVASTLDPQAGPEDRTYAPGIGLISGARTLKLTAFSDVVGADGRPVLSIHEAVLLTWPLTDQMFRIQGSPDLENWKALGQSPLPVDGRYQHSAPKDADQKYFRLVSP